MLKKSIYCGVIALCLGALTTASAGESSETTKLKSEFDGIAETTPPNEIDWETRAQLGGAGNVTVYVDENGIPKEVYVIGIAPVSTTLVAVEAEEEASEEAGNNAKATFAKWMSEHFIVKTVQDKKVLVVRKNGEEQSESVSISQRHAEQMASGAWRGMSIFKRKLSNGRCIAVYRWSVTEQNLAKMVEMLTRDGNTESKSRKVDMKVQETDWISR